MSVKYSSVRLLEINRLDPTHVILVYHSNIEFDAYFSTMDQMARGRFFMPSLHFLRCNIHSCTSLCQYVIIYAKTIVALLDIPAALPLYNSYQWTSAPFPAFRALLIKLFVYYQIPDCIFETFMNVLARHILKIKFKVCKIL